MEMKGMNTQRQARIRMVACGLMLLGAALGRAASDGRSNTNTWLTVSLSDGSRVTGKPPLSALPMQTPYAHLALAFPLIRSATLQADHETLQVLMVNGDRINAVPDQAEIRLETLVGPVVVPMGRVASFAVQTGGLPPGLIFWNRLDGAASVIGAPVTVLQKDSYVPGKVGNAIQVSGDQTWALQIPGDVFEGTSKGGTIEYWVKVVNKPPTASHGSGPWYDFMGGALLHRYCANDGAAHGKFCIRPTGYWVYTERYSGSVSTDLMGADGVWNHHALVWDAAGFKDLDGAKLAFYINGERHGHYKAGDAAGPFCFDEPPEYLTVHRNVHGFGAVMVFDELRIWDHPVRDFTSAGRTWVGDLWGKADGTPSRFSLELVDGSRLIGTMRLDVIPVQTASMGRIQTPLRCIQQMRRAAEQDGPVELVLSNGDILVGTLDLPDFPVESIFGRAAVDVRLIRSLQLHEQSSVGADRESRN
jgi:hypothetical protein